MIGSLFPSLNSWKCFTLVLSRTYSSTSLSEEPSRPAQGDGEQTLACWPPRASIMNTGGSRAGILRNWSCQLGNFPTMNRNNKTLFVISYNCANRPARWGRSWSCHEDVAASCWTQRQKPRERHRPQRRQPCLLSGSQQLRRKPATQQQQQQTCRAPYPSERPQPTGVA